MKLTPMKPPNPLASPPSPQTRVYEWIVSSGAYDQVPARLYVTVRLPDSNDDFLPDILVDIPPETTMQEMEQFTERGAKLIQFFTMPRNNYAIAACAFLILVSLVSAIQSKHLGFVATFGLSILLLFISMFGGGANEHARKIQHYLEVLKLRTVNGTDNNDTSQIQKSFDNNLEIQE